MSYINDPGFEVPDNTILVIPDIIGSDGYYSEVIKPLKGEIKREWFNSHFYYCLPLTIGNQYGFVINSMRDFTIEWNGSNNQADDVKITFLNDDNAEKQTIQNGFSTGVVTIQNHFALKTPPGVNLMTIQPPNMYIPTCVAMTGVIETDQIRRDFTFNMKMTLPNHKVTIKKGDPLGAFIPVPRYFIDSFNIDIIDNHFDRSFHIAENQEVQRLSAERNGDDKQKAHQAGRRYFKGMHSNNDEYLDHQQRIVY